MVARNCKNILFELSEIEEKIKFLEETLDKEAPELNRSEILEKVLRDYSIFKSSKAS